MSKNKGKLKFSEKTPKDKGSDSKKTLHSDTVKENRFTIAEISENINEKGKRDKQNGENVDIDGNSQPDFQAETKSDTSALTPKKSKQQRRIDSENSAKEQRVTVEGDSKNPLIADSGENVKQTPFTNSGNIRTKDIPANNTADDGSNIGIYLTDKPKSKLQFDKKEIPSVPKKEKADRKIDKLEQKDHKYGEKLETARDKLPGKKVEKKKLVFTEENGKDKISSKLTFEKEHIPIGEAKWNKPKKKSVPGKVVRGARTMAVNKIHAKVHQVEHENVGVKAAHQAELVAESAYRGGKKTAQSAYRFHKNRPYRKVAKLEQKSVRNKKKLDYKKAVRDKPIFKSNPISRFQQKRAIKRNYAAALKKAKRSGKATKKSVGLMAKGGKILTALIRKNPIFLIKAGLLLLFLFLIMSVLSMCMGMFSGGTGFIGASTFVAEDGDITNASVLYTELETDLVVYINEIAVNHPGFDEYRLNIGYVGHNPFELMSFLTAMYQEFSFSAIESNIRNIFAAHYNLELTEVVEIRTRTETRSNPDGGTYTVTVQYEWRILYVTLTSRPFSQVLNSFMNEEQTEHYNVLMQSLGARQFVGSPFDFDWLPHVSSLYGYRVHPIHGDKRYHAGIDIALPTGTPIRAGFDGRVVSVRYEPDGYGNVVVIESDDGIRALYAHCDAILVSNGQTVTQGEIIATVGNTGASTGAHLHMEVSLNGRRLNPIFFVESRVW